MTLYQLRQYKDALAAFDESLAINSQSATTHSNRGIILYELKRYNEALAAYDRSLAINPRNCNTHWPRHDSLSVAAI